MAPGSWPLPTIMRAHLALRPVQLLCVWVAYFLLLCGCAPDALVSRLPWPAAASSMAISPWRTITSRAVLGMCMRVCRYARGGPETLRIYELVRLDMADGKLDRQLDTRRASLIGVGRHSADDHHELSLMQRRAFAMDFEQVCPARRPRRNDANPPSDAPATRALDSF